MSMLNSIKIIISQLYNSPAGRLKTPAPTIPLTRLNISLEIVALPPLVGCLALSVETLASSLLFASLLRGVVIDLDALFCEDLTTIAVGKTEKADPEADNASRTIAVVLRTIFTKQRFTERNQ